MQFFKRWAFRGAGTRPGGRLVVPRGRLRIRARQGSHVRNHQPRSARDGELQDKDEQVGKNGVYLSGDTPASTKFATGRFILEPGKTPHAPHTHIEEEVMIIESGHGEIFCDGKTTKVGPGSVMYTTPNTSHGITNTGSEPIVFYYIKWAGKN